MIKIVPRASLGNDPFRKSQRQFRKMFSLQYSLLCSTLVLTNRKEACFTVSRLIPVSGNVHSVTYACSEQQQQSEEAIGGRTRKGNRISRSEWRSKERKWERNACCKASRIDPNCQTWETRDDVCTWERMEEGELKHGHDGRAIRVTATTRFTSAAKRTTFSPTFPAASLTHRKRLH